MLVAKKLTKIGKLWTWQLLKQNTTANRGPHSPPCTQSQDHSNTGKTGIAMYYYALHYTLCTLPRGKLLSDFLRGLLLPCGQHMAIFVFLIHFISLFFIAGAWTWTATLGSSGPRGWTSWTPAPLPLSRALTRTMDPTPSVNLKPRQSGGEDQQKQKYGNISFPGTLSWARDTDWHRTSLSTGTKLHDIKCHHRPMFFYLLQLWE